MFWCYLLIENFVAYVRDFLKFRLSFSVRTRQDSLFVWVCQVSWFPELEYGIFCSFVCVCVFFSFNILCSPSCRHLYYKFTYLLVSLDAFFVFYTLHSLSLSLCVHALWMWVWVWVLLFCELYPFPLPPSLSPSFSGPS